MKCCMFSNKMNKVLLSLHFSITPENPPENSPESPPENSLESQPESSPESKPDLLKCWINFWDSLYCFR